MLVFVRRVISDHRSINRLVAGRIVIGSRFGFDRSSAILRSYGLQRGLALRVHLGGHLRLRLTTATTTTTTTNSSNTQLMPTNTTTTDKTE